MNQSPEVIEQTMRVKADSLVAAEASFRELVTRAFPGSKWKLLEANFLHDGIELVYQRMAIDVGGGPGGNPGVEAIFARDTITRPAARLVQMREQMLRTHESLLRHFQDPRNHPSLIEPGMLVRLTPDGPPVGRVLKVYRGPDGEVCADIDFEFEIDFEIADETFQWIDPIREAGESARVLDREAEEREADDAEREDVCDRLGLDHDEVLDELLEEEVAETSAELEPTLELERARRTEGLKPLSAMSAAERQDWERKRLRIQAKADQVFSRPTPATKTVWRPWVLVAFWATVAALAIAASLTLGVAFGGAAWNHFHDRPELVDFGGPAEFGGITIGRGR